MDTMKETLMVSLHKDILKGHAGILGDRQGVH